MKYIILYIIGIVAIIYLVNGIGLNCNIIEAGNCTNTSAIVLYMKNDSGGYFNAHAANSSNSSYPYVICCNTTTSANITTRCNDTIFLRLSNTTNAHVQLRNLTNATNATIYNVTACMSADAGKITCNNYNGSCPANYECLTSIASSEAWAYNETNAHVGNCSEYTTKICCKLNTRPNKPILISPPDGNITTNRTPTFIWNATDPDNDTLTFDLFIRCYPSCSVDNREHYNLTNMNYTLQDELNYFSDDGYYYEWYVRAFDNITYSENSSIFNFSLQSEVILTLINATVNFGNISMGEKKNTTSNATDPFLLRNDGNSIIDVNITADDMIWDTQPSASKYFQYKVDIYPNESGSFNYSGSVTNWTYIPISNESIIDFFNYTNTNDTAEIDILIEVPLSESSGAKSGLLTFTGWYVSETG